jgi:hypothetical protein
VPDIYRAVEVFGDAPRYGSGCMVTPSLLLTARHLFGDHDDAEIQVRDREGRSATARPLWRGTEQDLALLRVEGFQADGLEPLRVGRLPAWDGDAREFAMFGWPRAGASQLPDGTWDRAPVEAVGTLRPRELTAGRLIRLRPDDRHPQLSDGSWWEGISGAAVFVAGALIGIEVSQPRKEIPDYLAAQPLVGDHPDQQRLLEVLAAEGVGVVPALGPGDAALRAYLEKLNRRLGAPPKWFPERLRQAGDTVERLYQQPTLESSSPSSKGPLRALGEVADDSSLVLLEGPAGCGKSWTLEAHARELAGAALARAEAEAGDRTAPLDLPVWCRLDDIPAGQSASQLLKTAIERVAGEDAPPLASKLLGAEVRWQLLVDGVDEASEESKKALDWIVSELLAGSGPLARIVVATRPAEFEVSSGPRIESLQLAGIDARTQRALVGAWFDGHPTQVDAVLVLADHWRLREAFHTPLVLALTCVVTEECEEGQPLLHTSADVFRATAETLIGGDHHAGALKPVSAAAQRAERRTMAAAMELAAQLFTSAGYQPSLPLVAVEGIDAAALDACIDTGLMSLRADGGVDFANRSIAAYLAAQHHAAQGSWEGELATVWESEAIAEVMGYVPHALAALLLPAASPASAERWFVAAEELTAGGDPGFLLMHTACRALSFLAPESLPDVKDRWARRLEAHVLAGIDPRAADGLVTLAPAELARIAAGAETEERIWFALILANVGDERGFELLDDAFLGGLEDNVALAVLEWFARRGTTVGLQRVRSQAESAPSVYRRLVASLILTRWDVEGAEELLAASLREETEPSWLTPVAAAVLADRDNEVGYKTLRQMLESSDPELELRAIIWWPEEDSEGEEQLAPEAAERLKRLAAAGSAQDADHKTMEVAIVASFVRSALAVERGTAAEREAAITDFVRIAELPDPGRDALYEKRDQLPVAAAVMVAELDREAVMPILEAQAKVSSARGFTATVCLFRIDPDRGARMLLRLSSDPEARSEDRVGAFRILEVEGRPEAKQAGNAVAGLDEDDLDFVSAASAQKKASDRLAFFFGAVGDFLSEPSEALEGHVDAFRDLPEVRPSDGIWRDGTDYLFRSIDGDPGISVELFEKFDLGSEVDRLALAISIPVIDNQAGRSYMAMQASLRSPSDDWLLAMARWSVLDFAGSFRDHDPSAAAVLEMPIRRMHEILPGLLDWAAIAWQDEGWTVGRCLPIVMDHLTSRAMLEMAHHHQGPILRDTLRGLLGVEPMAGLSDPDLRACVSLACDEAMATVLEGRTEPAVVARREELLARAASLACAHASN